MGVKVELEIKKILQDGNDLHKFIILLTHSNNEPIKGMMKLQKMMYLLSDLMEEVKEQCSYVADNYGPYSKVVAKEARYLEQIGVLTGNVGEIALTQMGKEIAQELYKNEDEELLEILNEYKDFLNSMTRNELLAYIYSAYPDTAKESIEYENLKPNMEKYIMSMVKKHIISSQRAAELLKQTHTSIIKKMKDMNMIILR